MELAIYNIKGEDTGRKAVLNDEVFAIDVNEHAIYLDVKQFLANQRQGTHKSKERSEVSGSTRKLHKQKGGGGCVFGPRPRDYRFKLNKKLKNLARRSALSLKAKEGQITVVEDFTFEAPKTKSFAEVQNNLKVAGKKNLFVTAAADANVALSARNIPDTRIMRAADLNTYAVMNNAAVVITESAVEIVNKL